MIIMKPSVDTIYYQVEELTTLLNRLRAAKTLDERMAILDDHSLVVDYLKENHLLRSHLKELALEEAYVLKAVLAIGQGPILFNPKHLKAEGSETFKKLLEKLVELERFYRPLGGLIGYHLTVLSAISKKNSSHKGPVAAHDEYRHPEGLNIDHDSAEVRKAVREGIAHLTGMAEIYPMGGAGERLNLIDENTGKPLPVASLRFNGRTLLEGLIRDVQAREYLYHKLHQKQVTVPLVIMTSQEKDNHDHITLLCQESRWFGRSQQSFAFIKQEQVPVITSEGSWSLSAPLTLTLKPGGHGVIWKLAQDAGAFSWLLKQGRTKSLVRQVNNPIAGLDHALIALAGVGCHEEKAFGFASCERLTKAAEGVDVVIEHKTDNGYEYCLTNIEYTEFADRGIEDVPATPHGQFSLYPSNTNILFVDIPSIVKALESCPFPGPIINMKNKVSYIDSAGKTSSVEGGRLELTMQNIADALIYRTSQRLKKNELKDALGTFIIYNRRIKTISTTKTAYKAGETSNSTPEHAFFDLLTNHFDLFTNSCRFDMPVLGSEEEYLRKGPGFHILYHPALGPLYSVIGQKVRNGRMHMGAELQLEIGEADIDGLELSGSLLVEAQSPLGSSDHEGKLVFDGREGRCVLHNVFVRNKGIDREARNCFWKNEISRHERLHIVLGEGAEFEAHDVTFNGDFVFAVPNDHKLVVTQKADGKLITTLTAIERPTWAWHYAFDDDNRIVLTKTKLK